MKLLPEVCLGPRNNPLSFEDDPDYGPGQGCDTDRAVLRSGSWQVFFSIYFTLVKKQLSIKPICEF